jgi:hypothetical protein
MATLLIECTTIVLPPMLQTHRFPPAYRRPVRGAPADPPRMALRARRAGAPPPVYGRPARRAPAGRAVRAYAAADSGERIR